MSDIVERLRERPYRHAAENEAQAAERRQRERNEGADTIEALRGEVKAILQREHEQCIALGLEIKELRSDAEKAEAERDRLKAALETIAHDNVPREVFIVWRTDGSNSKHDKCQHMRMMYEDCGNCTALFARKALGGGE